MRAEGAWRSRGKTDPAIPFVSPNPQALLRPLRLCSLELRQEVARAGLEQTRQCHVDEEGAQREVAAGARAVGGEHAGRPTGGSHATHGVLDCRLDVRVVHLAGIAHRLGEVSRRDEEGVDLLDLQDVVQILQRLDLFESIRGDVATLLTL